MEACEYVPIKRTKMISIIVPAYNVEEYISNCIDSILNQNYEDIEIIIINDGSTDSTGLIIDEFCLAYPEKIICIHQKNQGVTSARLNGLRIAKGEWIGFVDGDDYIEKEMYERLLSNAVSHQADISHCGYQTVVNNGERIHYFYNTGKLLEQNKEEGIKDLLNGLFIEPSLCTKLYHRSLFNNVLQNNITEKRYQYNEDLLLNYLLFKESDKSVYEDFCPYHYVARSNSATRDSFNANKILDPISVQEFILNDTEGELKNEAYRRYLQTCLNACHALYNKPEYKEEYEKARDVLKRYDLKSRLLNRNNTLKLQLFLMSPVLYNRLHKIYADHLQKKRYE